MSDPNPPEPSAEAVSQSAAGCRPQVKGCLFIGVLIATTIGMIAAAGLLWLGSDGRAPEEEIGLGFLLCQVFDLQCGEDGAVAVDPGELMRGVSEALPPEGTCAEPGVKDHAVVIFQGVSGAQAEDAWGRLQAAGVEGFVVVYSNSYWNTDLYRSGLTRCEAEKVAEIAVEVGNTGLHTGNFFGAVVLPWAGSTDATSPPAAPGPPAP